MDARRLAQTLIMGEVLTAADVESALQRQVVLGGSLDTNLLESELLSEEAVIKAMGEAYGLPVAARKEIDAIAPHIPRLFPLVFAETYHLVPMRLVEQTLSVLTNGLPDVQICDRITERLNLAISPILTTETRLHYAMHRLYGVELLPRFNTLLAKLDGDQPASVPNAAATGEQLSWGVSSARIARPGGASGKLRGQDVRTLVARLDAATNRDSMVEILLGFALAAFEFAGLFVLHGEHVNGWRSTDAEATKRLTQISLPLSEASVFQTIHSTQGHYLGPLPHNDGNAKLLSQMGRQPPRAAFLAPIVVGGKLAAILYADNGPQSVLPKRVAALLVLVQRTALGLEGLIHRRKGAAAKLADAPPAPVRAGPSEDDFGTITEKQLKPPAAVAATAPRKRADWTAPIGVALKDSPQPLPERDGFAGLDLETDLADRMPVAASTEHPESDEEIYVAFADIDESPEQSLDEWEDVMVDTLSDSTKSDLAATAKGPDSPSLLSITWDDVVNEAQAASRLVPQTSHTVEVLGTKVEERDIWFDGLDADDPESRRTAVAKLLPLGNSIDAEIAKRFPGRLAFNPLERGLRPPPFEQCSGITELLAARGVGAAAVILPQLESDDAARRFFAIYFMLAVPTPDGVEALARRLYDTEPRNRHLAIEALRRYKAAPTYGRIVQSLREQLKVQVPESQAAAIQILGQLREPSVVPSLIPLVGISQPEIARTAASALAVICAQSFGTDLQQWQMWWQGNYTKPRAVWLVSGLGHPNALIRRVANNELQHLTGQTVPFDPEAPEGERRQAVQTWERWLQTANATGGLPS